MARLEPSSWYDNDLPMVGLQVWEVVFFIQGHGRISVKQ